ncbi:MAG: hypothetical protein WCP04_11690 [Pseudomonadota bacterium]|jgi:hypothetical protein
MDPRATTPHPFRQRHPLLVYVLCPPLAATVFVIALLALFLHLGGDALKAHLTADTVGAWRLGLQTLTLYLVPWMVCHHTLRNAQRDRVAPSTYLSGAALTALLFACANVSLEAPSALGAQPSLGAGLGFSTQWLPILTVLARLLGVVAAASLTVRWRAVRA